MSAPYDDLQCKTEAALKARVDTVSLTNRGDALSFVGLDCDIELPKPRIECHAEEGPEDPVESGNFWLDCTIAVISDANLALSVHRSRCKYVFDAFAVDFDTLRTALSGYVSDFTVIGVRNRTKENQIKEGVAVKTAIRMELLCCPSDL